MSVSTQLSNGTKHAMKVLVGTGHHASELATVEAGGKYTIGVDYNATYREYTVGLDAPGMEKFVVDTDDLCDNKCITIKEDSDCKVEVHKEPRHVLLNNTAASTAAAAAPTKSGKKSSWFRSWMSK